jgi:hypothetical protein
MNIAPIIKRPLVVVVASAGCLLSVASPAAASGTGAITGTVTNNAASPAPLANICAELDNATTGSFLQSVATDASGHYTLTGIATGTYKVKFTDCSQKGFLTQYYNNASSLATASSVVVSGGATTTGINAKMVLGGKITGTVNSHAGTALAKMCVAADSAPGAQTASAYTNASGQYVIRGLPTGSYKVDFYDCAGTDYVEQYYSNQVSYSSGNPVSVTNGNVTASINASLLLGGKIAGAVTNNAAGPAPLGGMCVSALTTSGTFVSGTTTPANGQYSIRGLPVASYKVVFGDCGKGGYVSQYYNNKATLANANPVSVAKGITTTGVSAKLVPAGKISGTVTNNAAAPLGKICVDALDPAQAR